MNLRKGELTPPQKSEVFSTRSGGLLQEQDYIGSSFSSQEGNHCSRECVPDLNLGGMELRLAPPQAVELAQESVKDEAFYGSGAGHFHQEPGSKADKGVCFEQISCREKLTTLPTSNIRLEAEKTPPTDSMNVVPEKLSSEIDRKQKQAAELFSRSIVSEKQIVGDSIAGSNFWHAQKLQQQQMAVSPELTPFHLALRAQQQTELSRHGWGGAFNGLAWSQFFIPGVQEQDNKGIPQMLVYGGYGHQVEVSNVAPSPLSQASGILAGNAHTKELEKQQTPKMLTSSTYYISEQSTTASGPLYLGSQLQGKMAGNTGYGTIDPKLWPNSSIQLTAEADYCVRSSHATVKEKTANASSPPVVGWPPVQSFRKNSAVAHCQSKPPNQCQALPLAGTSSLPSPSPPDGGVSSLFVKVYMDGVPIGRKVDLKANSSYEKLSLALEEMFEQFVIGHCVQEKFLSKREKLSPSSDKKPSFLHGSDYVMTYEDKDGDLMLVGDVPWSLFARTVKRLRIMKGCEAIGFDRAKEKAMN